MASIVRMRGSRVALTEAHRLAAVFLREKKTKAGKAKKLDVSAAAAAKYNEDVPDPEEVAMVMADTVAHFRHDLGFMRLEAHPKMLERVFIPAYGGRLPLTSMALISVKDRRTLAVTCFDSNSVKDVVKGIQIAGLGLNPSVAGQHEILVPVPEPTDKSLADMRKNVSTLAEDTRAHIRLIRRETLGKMEKSGSFTKDELRALEKRIQKFTDTFVGQVDTMSKQKQEEFTQ